MLSRLIVSPSGGSWSSPLVPRLSLFISLPHLLPWPDAASLCILHSLIPLWEDSADCRSGPAERALAASATPLVSCPSLPYWLLTRDLQAHMSLMTALAIHEYLPCWPISLCFHWVQRGSLSAPICIQMADTTSTYMTLDCKSVYIYCNLGFLLEPLSLDWVLKELSIFSKMESCHSSQRC